MYNYHVTIKDRKTDNRMRWIREIERTRSTPNEKRYIEQHEIVSECGVEGLLLYEDELMSAWSSLYKNSYIHTLHTYTLRFALAEGDRSSYTDDGSLILTASPSGYFSESYEDEILSLLSLKLHLRFFHVHTTTLDVGEISHLAISYGPPFTYHPCTNVRKLKSDLFSGKGKNIRDAIPILDAVKQLPAPQHSRFYRAISSYAAGIRWIGVDNQLAYLRLTSAIESLSSRKGGSKKRDFIKFIKDYGVGYFDGRPTKPRHIWVTMDRLEEVAGAIYRARSNYLHDGEVMWISHEMGNDNEAGRGWDWDGSVGMVRDQREWSQREHLPTVMFFEELVRHCLLSYLEMNTKIPSN